METLTVLLLVGFVCTVCGLPLETSVLDFDANTQAQESTAHSIRRRFISSEFSLGSPDTNDIVRMRTKRSYDECEKLQLCKLHARSQHSFFAAFQLYFVNKENAKAWDHQPRSMADCEERYGYCYDK